MPKIDLQTATGPMHERLDERLCFLLAPELSRERYRRALAAFYGFYLPLERWLSAARGLEPAFPARWVSRAALIARDLDLLGASTDDLPVAPWRAPSTPGWLGGALYVVEGAGLGGQVIARALGRSLGLDESNGASFFVGEAEATRSRFTRVMAWLETLASSEEVQADLASGAQHTFAGLHGWLVSREVIAR